MKKIIAGLLAVAGVLLMLPVSPATADSIQSGDGILIGAFPYVFENDAYLEHLSDSSDVPTAPDFIVVNIGNGQTDDVGHLDTILPAIRARGIKVYGYVDTNSLSRSTYDMAADAARYINPYNPERSVGGQIVDGIFLDRYPRDCGPIETPTNNTANDADYVLAADSIIDNIKDQFAFWSYSNGLVMSNVGTAVRGCHPGWTGLSGHPMSDYYVTAENTASSYLAGWAGGNIITGGAFGTTYEDGNNYYPNKFVHIVHTTSTMADTEKVIDLADTRGASRVAVTDDVMSNPYDAEPTYLNGSIQYASLGHLGLRFDFNEYYDAGGGNPAVLFQERAGNPCDNPGTPGTVERCPWPEQALEIIYNTVNAVCTSGTWGTAGTAVSAHDISSTRVNCAMALAQDETGRDSIAVVCYDHFREWSDEDATNDEADCQDPDGSGNYGVTSDRSSTLRADMFGNYDKTEAVLVYARNRVVAGIQYSADYPTYAANCIVGANPIPLPYRLCP